MDYYTKLKAKQITPYPLQYKSSAAHHEEYECCRRVDLNVIHRCHGNKIKNHYLHSYSRNFLNFYDNNSILVPNFSIWIKHGCNEETVNHTFNDPFPWQHIKVLGTYKLYHSFGLNLEMQNW